MKAKEQPRILVVDDQPINIKLLQRKLERQGMDVLVAYNGYECLKIVKEESPNLILLDVMMPEMDGIETCERLKKDPTTATIPVIFITAKASKEGKLEGLSAGAVDYITKPIDLDETLARVRTQLRLQKMFQQNLHLEERLGDARRAASVGAITQGIAHNLNNLLGVVVGYLDLIKNGYNSPDMLERSVGLMDNAINRMVGIIRQLGTIANNERASLSPHGVRELIESSVERFREEHTINTPVHVHLHLAETTTFDANAEIFEIMMGKLLINAWESYDRHRSLDDRPITVDVTIEQPSDLSLLTVRVVDAGLGIDPTVKNSLFEPFVTTKTAVGRGMGLTIARHTIRNLNGDLRLIENESSGCTAVLTHPV